MRWIKASLALGCGLAIASSSASAAPRLPLSHAGRWITDATGRVVILHGVNMVYKLPPYYPSAAGFGDDDAAYLQRIGFNAVRVGVIWKAVEPSAGVYDNAYLAKIAATVATLKRHGIVSLLDFHQDMYNERFQGEGAPDWAVDDDDLPPSPQFGFPTNYLQMPALQKAEDNFWANRGGLQNRYASAWRHVALRFRSDRAVLGYELLNEPPPGSSFGACLGAPTCPVFDSQLDAFDHRVSHAIRSVDRRTLMFYEPSIMFDFGQPTEVGALGDPHAGFAFHDYCLNASSAGCPNQASDFRHALAHVASTREALLLTEFGSNAFAINLQRMVALADRNMVPWLEWSYCPCHDPTGATPDPIVEDPSKPPAGANIGSLAAGTLVEPYPQVIAGTPRSYAFARDTRTFTLAYRTQRAGSRTAFAPGAVTEVATPAPIYHGRYAVQVSGGAILSAPGAATLRIASCPHARRVSVAVTPAGRTRESCILTRP